LFEMAFCKNVGILRVGVTEPEFLAHRTLIGFLPAEEESEELMIRRFVCLLLLVAVVYWPSQTEEATALLASLRTPHWAETGALEECLDRLEGRGVDLADQGIRIESVDGGLILGDHQGDQSFNPASVIKVATTLAALEQFGADHRFETVLYLD